MWQWQQKQFRCLCSPPTPPPGAGCPPPSTVNWFLPHCLTVVRSCRLSVVNSSFSNIWSNKKTARERPCLHVVICQFSLVLLWSNIEFSQWSSDVRATRENAALQLKQPELSTLQCYFRRSFIDNFLDKHCCEITQPNGGKINQRVQKRINHMNTFFQLALSNCIGRFCRRCICHWCIEPRSWLVQWPKSFQFGSRQEYDSTKQSRL